MQRPLSRQQTLSQTMCMRRMRSGSFAGWIAFLRSVVFAAHRACTMTHFGMGVGPSLAIITSTAPPDDPGSPTPMSDAPHAETYLCRSMFWRALRVGAVLVTVVGLTAVDGAVLTPDGGIVVSLIVVLNGLVWAWPPMTGTVNGFQIDAQGAFWIRRWRAFERVDPATFGMIRTVASDNGRLQVSTKAVFSQGRGAWRRLVVPLHAVTARGSGAYVPPGRASAILGTMCAHHGLVVQPISDTAGTWMASPTAGATTQAVQVIRTRAAIRDRLVLVSVGGVLLIGGVTLVVQTVQANRITADIQHHGIPISGQVVGIERRGKTTWVTFRYALEAGASPRQATCQASPAIGTYREQQAVVVRAIPARPERALAEACAAYGSSSDRGGIIMGTVLALLGIGMSRAGIRRTKGKIAAIPT
jgi:hypothetical protein